jgi:hypothetical protein
MYSTRSFNVCVTLITNRIQNFDVDELRYRYILYLYHTSLDLERNFYVKIIAFFFF